MCAYSEPGRTKGGSVEVILPSSSSAWRLRRGSFGNPPRVSCLLVPFFPSKQYVVSHCPRHLVISLQVLLRPQSLWSLNPRPIPIFSEDLGIHIYIFIPVACINFPHHALPYVCFEPLAQFPLGNVQLVFDPLGDRKTVSLHL